MTKTLRFSKFLAASAGLALSVVGPIDLAAAAPQRAAQHSEFWQMGSGRVIKITEGQVQVLTPDSRARAGE